MSKCDIRIQFDAADRTVRGGSNVTGRVYISVNEDIRCKKIALTYFWKVHGRGNTHKSKIESLILSEGTMLMSGEELEFSFEFQADCWPVTQHGHHINVDHYVHVGVDVPWAFDPKLEEDFIVVPGDRPSDLPESRGELADLSQGAGQLSGLAKVFVFGILGVLAVMLSVFLVVLLPVLAVVGLLVWFWKKAVEGRVGNVELTVPHVILTPGENWKVRLRFTPKKSFSINGITVRLKAVESATSGSGTNATTYNHTVFEETYGILPAGRLEAMQPIDEEMTIAIPTNAAYSLKQPSNVVSWDVVARIDIPRFPDWKKATKLQLLPSEFFDDAAVAVSATEDPVVQAKNAFTDAPVMMGATAPVSLAEASSTNADLMPLLRLLDSIAEAERYGNERTEILETAGSDAYDITMIIQRLVSTIDPTGNDDRFLGGKTIIGNIPGTEHEVELFTVVGSNELLEDLDRGDNWQTLANVTEWDTLHNRLVMHEVPFDA
ncbi:MAG: hypothetical protein ABJZ55_03835 [Fuerstiella sp.]